MSEPVLNCLRKQIDEVKNAPVFSKVAQAEKALEMALAILTDFENRLKDLERSAP